MQNQPSKRRPSQASDGLVEGFSLIELVVVIAVLAILSSLGIFAILSFIDDAKLAAAKISLTNAVKECQSDKDPSLISGNDIVFSGTDEVSPPDCNDSMRAVINHTCCISINPVNNEKGSWPDSYEDCNSCSANLNKPLIVDGIPRDEDGRPLITDDTHIANVWNYVPDGRGGGCTYSAAVLKTYEPEDPRNQSGKDFMDGATAVMLDSSHPKSFNPNNEQYCQAVEIPAGWFEDNTLPEPWEIKKGYYMRTRYGTKGKRLLKQGLFNEDGRPIMIVPSGWPQAAALKRYNLNSSTLTSGME